MAEINDGMSYRYVECECSAAEHVVRFVYCPTYKNHNEGQLEEPQLYMEVQLPQPHNFLKRIWLAIKYILKIEHSYGYWDCILLSVHQADQITKIMEEYKKDNKVFENRKDKGY